MHHCIANSAIIINSIQWLFWSQDYVFQYLAVLGVTNTIMLLDIHSLKA